jgi:iron complex outermembrane receptor protein
VKRARAPKSKIYPYRELRIMHAKSKRARHRTQTIAAAMLTTGAVVVHAEPAPDPDAAAIPAEVVVTGTRREGIAAIDSPAPVQVIDASALKRVGQPDLIQSLAQNLPSFTAQAFGGDTANLTLSARLRGVSPNHALVLINGKRRHTTANLAVLGGPYQGAASADLNFIPVDAIERIEVLQDGAAAQYGPDAIAGVVNLILKKNAEGGSFSTNGGKFDDGGGDTGDIGGNIGFAPTDNSFINLTGETRTHSKTDRGGIDPRALQAKYMPAILDAPGYPYVNHIQGDASYHLTIASFNSGIDFDSGAQLYSFGTYGKKHAQAFENYRTPDRIPALYPNGFNPQEELEESDYGATLGFKGKVAGDWGYDLSMSYGRDYARINTIASANISLFNDTGSTPTTFHSGNFISTQWTSTLDISRNFDIGLSNPLNFAFGYEHRRDGYEIDPGDAASRYKEGGQSYPGFQLTDAGSHSRDNNAGYVDFALSPTDKLQLDLAGRYEDFSDFGSTTVGKLTARYDFTQKFAMRGTVSTGFRAPTLAEEFYSATNVGPTSAFVQLPPNAAAAALVGINGLKPEKSRNLSLGFVMRPTDRLVATLDVYQIKIDDRIVGSGQLFGSSDGNLISPAVIAAIAANGNVLDPAVVAGGVGTSTGITMFSNGLNTRTRGADLVLSLPSEYSFGRIDWSLSGNYNKTEVTDIAPTPAPLAPQSFYDLTALSNLETASPKYRSVLGAFWSYSNFSANLRETVYGPSSRMDQRTSTTPFHETEIGVTPITDLELAYQTDSKSMKFSIGANNLFNRYPNGMNKDLLAEQRAVNSNSAVAVYPSFSPFGINGGYYYARALFTF